MGACANNMEHFTLTQFNDSLSKQQAYGRTLNLLKCLDNNTKTHTLYHYTLALHSTIALYFCTLPLQSTAPLTSHSPLTITFTFTWKYIFQFYGAKYGIFPVCSAWNSTECTSYQATEANYQLTMQFGHHKMQLCLLTQRPWERSCIEEW